MFLCCFFYCTQCTRSQQRSNKIRAKHRVVLSVLGKVSSLCKLVIILTQGETKASDKTIEKKNSGMQLKMVSSNMEFR